MKIAQSNVAFKVCPSSIPVPQYDEMARVAAAGDRYVETPENSGWPLPMCRSKRRVAGVNVHAIEIAARDFYDYVAVLDEGDLVKLLAAIHNRRQISDADCIILEQIIDANDLSLRKPATHVYRTHKIVAPPDGSLKSLLCRHQSVKRHVRAVRQKFDVVVESIVNQSAILRHLPSLAKLHVERWSFENIESVFLQPSRIRQYEEAAARALLTRVVVDGEVFAVHYGLMFANTLLWHTPVINVAFLEHSPLEVLMSAVADACDQRKITTIDLGLGYESYKARFANSSERICEYFIPLSWKGQMIAAVRKNLDTQRWREYYDRIFGSALKARIKVLQRLNRVRYFYCIGNASSRDSTDDYREVSIWRELVTLLRRSGIEVKRYQYDRVRRGHCFLCLLRDSKIVCHGWLSANDDPFVVGETGELIPAGTTVLYDFFTPEQYRKRGHYTRLLKAITAVRSNEKLCIFALMNNEASIAGIQRAGFVERNK
jgi:hypothetical protein